MPRFARGGKPTARRPDKGRGPKSCPDVRGQKPMRCLELRSNVTNHEELTTRQPRKAIGSGLNIIHKRARCADLVGDFRLANGPGNVRKMSTPKGDWPGCSNCCA